jgi:hypothetical protein
MPATIRSIDMQIIDKIFAMEGGYVLDFSDRTMAQFFAEELNIDDIGMMEAPKASDYDVFCERKTRIRLSAP